MWGAIAFFEMDLHRISQSCEFLKADPPDLPMVIGLVGCLLFSLSVVGRRYMDVKHIH